MSIIFCFILPWCSLLLLLMFLLCFTRFFFFFFFLLRLGEGRPPAATEDNYTNTDKSASTVTHSRVGVLPYATSYHLQRLCKTEKKSGAGHEGWTVCREPERPGTMERGRRIGSPRPQSLPRPTHWGQKKSHRFLKVPVTIIFFFFVLEVVVFYIVLLSVPQWHFTNTFLTVLKIFKLLWFFGWPTKSILFWFLRTKVF